MRGKLALTALSALILAACGGSDGGSSSIERSQGAASPAAADPAIAALAVPAGATASARIDRRLDAARGEVEVWVQLAEPSVAGRPRFSPGAARSTRPSSGWKRHTKHATAACTKSCTTRS